VRIAELPVEPEINGPDDFVARRGDIALWALVDDARPLAAESAADMLRLAGLDDIPDVELNELEGRLRRLKLALQGADALRRRTVREMLVGRLRAAKIGGAAALADAAIGGSCDETDVTAMETPAGMLTLADRAAITRLPHLIAILEYQPSEARAQ
jgi:hypothetical protein